MLFRSVLGTKFMVDQMDESMTVECYEGAVQVTTPIGEQVLNAGERAICTPQGIKTISKEVTPVVIPQQPIEEEEVEEEVLPEPIVVPQAKPIEPETIPEPVVEKVPDIPQDIIYDNEPLINVVSQIEKLYGVTITPKELCEGLNYTGIFWPNDKESTLEMVFGSCGLIFNHVGDQIYLEAMQ